MKLIKQTLLFLFCLSSIQLSAQKMNWKKHFNLAEQLYKEAQYADAGEHYKKAWQMKSKKTDLALKAGECFDIIRDYRNAADAYKPIKNMNDKYPKVQLKYAQALKQAGDFDNASHEFADFLANYQGADKSDVARMVQNEIKGCALARRFNNNETPAPVNVVHLSEAINTPETEFAPLPFNDEILYFSSTMAKRAEIYRSKNINGEWTKAKVPETFPKIENDHFCNGSLSPDQKRFYFTICKSVESWGGLTTQCNLYVIERKGRSWTQPERLRDYINMDGYTTTHPYVVHQGNAEVLYFASNRPEGKGGMDIWYTTRSINSSSNDFSYPINAGSKVNTPGDEITPYYNEENEILYFASNGHPNVGGYDIFRANGSKSFWTEAVNVGLPYNSSADDFAFTKSPSGKVGYFVSNRTFETSKISTTDEDIFSFTASDEKELFAEGGVYDKQNGELLSDVNVSIYQLSTDGSRSEMMSDTYEDGRYRFVLFPERKYEIEASKEGFLTQSYIFETTDFYKYEDYGQPLYITATNSAEVVKATPPVVQKPAISTPEVIKDETIAVQPIVEEKVEIIPEKAEPIVKKVQTNPVTEPTTTIEKTESIVMEEPAVDNWVQPTTATTSTMKDAVYRPIEEVTTSSYTPATTTETQSVTTSAPTTRTNISPSTNYTTTEPTSTIVATKVKEIPVGTEYTMRGKSPRDNYEVVTSAPRRMGEYFKVQLIAVKTFNPDHSRYNPVENMGRLDTEYIVDRGLTRVLLAEYHSYDEAKAELRRVRKFKNFERAYLVKYRDGERIGRVN